MSKILIIDDSMVIRKMVNKSLVDQNHETAQAENGQEGFELFSDGDYDLIITDINMPIMNGFELIKKIRELPKGGNVPIIVLSTEFSDDIKQQGKDLGVNAWMVKPTQDDTLNEVVTALLNR